MARVKLIEQAAYEFHYPVTVLPRDVNYGGHMGYDAVISLIGAARAYLLRSAGLSEGDLGDGRTAVIMSDLVVNYKAQGYMFDEMTVDTHVGEFSRTGFRMFHRLRRGETLVALVETGFAAFDYEAGKIVPVPARFPEAVLGEGAALSQ